MNVLVTKFMAARFNSYSDVEKMYGGCDVNALTFKKIAESYPEHTFYYAGASDLSKSDIDIPQNLKDLYTPIKTFAKANGYDMSGKDPTPGCKPFYKAAVDYCKNEGLNFDLALYLYDQTFSVCHYADGFISEVKGTPLKTLVSQRSMAHTLVLANDLNVPLYLMVIDPRQINKIVADINPPKLILGQCNTTDHTRYYVDKEKKEVKEVPMIYSGIERFWLLSKERVDFTDPDDINPNLFESYKKDNEFVMTLNGSLFRLEYIRKWLFPFRPKQKVYGKWDWGKLDEKVRSYGLEKNFVHRGMTEMEDVMWRTKYTFVVPADKSTTNFVTQKVYSMLYYGIIPFWDKNAYDTDNYYKDIPEYCKVETPQELWDKIDYLNKNPEEYKKLLKQCYEALKPEYFTNEHIHLVFDRILRNKNDRGQT